jgi:two-component system, NtrC family, response regulator GlrR
MIPQNAKRILILDDHETRSMLGLLLTEEGYHVTTANSGLEAISLQHRQAFDLIIIELAMNEKDGFETFMTLRREAASTKLIAVSNLGWVPAEITLKMARQLGAHATLAKPFDTKQMVAAVRDALNE